MNKFTEGIIIALAGLLFSGCVSLRQTTVELDIYEPPGFPVTQAYKNVGIVYRNHMALDDSLTQSFAELFPESRHTERFRHHAVADFYIRMLYNYLTDTEYYDKITLLPDSRGQISDTSQIELMLHLEEIAQYKSEYPDMDLLLFLDFFETEHYFSPPSSSCISLVWVNTSNVWQICDLASDIPSYFKINNDKIAWQVGACNIQKAISKLPAKETAILDGAEEAAAAFVLYLTPHWDTVSRVIYVFRNSELKNAHKLAKENRWNEAAKLWEKQTENKNRTIAAKAAYNMALASEIAGDMPAALDWLEKSEKAKIFDYQGDMQHKANVAEYIRVLQKRKEAVEKLDRLDPPNDF